MEGLRPGTLDQNPIDMTTPPKRNPLPQWQESGNVMNATEKVYTNPTEHYLEHSLGQQTEKGERFTEVSAARSARPTRLCACLLPAF